MEQKIILFQGGTHGNFLSRYLNVATGTVEDFDFYSKNLGAHAVNKDLRDNSKFIPLHPRSILPKDIYVYITINKNDLYKLIWHTFYAAGEFGLDLLDKSDDFNLKFQKKFNQTHPMVTNNISYKNFSKDSNGLREFFKFNFKKTNGFLTIQQGVIENYKINHLFQFSWFYNTEEFFIEKIKNLLVTDYIVASKNFKIFHEKKKNIIESEQKVHTALDAFLSNRHHNLQDFCLYEQAYFDHLIEEYFNLTVQSYYDEYPSNTLEYRVQEDK